MTSLDKFSQLNSLSLKSKFIVLQIWKKSGAWFSQKIHISDLEELNRAQIKRGSSSSSSSSKNLSDYYQQTDCSGVKSHLSSPVIRRKTKSSSPRRFREAISTESSGKSFSNDPLNFEFDVYSSVPSSISRIRCNTGGFEARRLKGRFISAITHVHSPNVSDGSYQT